MTLDDAANKVVVSGHKGPHPQAYHEAVYNQLQHATDGLSGQAYKDALLKQLGKISTECKTPGSMLNQLITK